MGRGKKKKGGPGPDTGPFSEFPQGGPTASHDYFHAEHQAWFDNLTDQQKWAMKNYVGHANNKMYEALNEAMRLGTFDPSQFPNSNQTSTYKGLVEAMNKNDGLPANTILHRGFSFPAMYSALNNGQLGVGDVINDDAFMSTSTLSSTATGFQLGNSPIKYRIKAPKGTKGAYMSWSPVNVYMHETEWLMPPGTKVRIDGMKKVTPGFGQSIWQLDVTVVEQD